ncbi:MAG: hypothetical protein AAGJ46_03545 [Planctomycetota bacterium]
MTSIEGPTARLYEGLVIALASVVPPVAATPVELPLTGVADADTRWFEHISDVFVELGQEPDGFYLISQLPNYVPVGQAGGIDAFSNDENSDLGTLTYDGSALTGSGIETAAVLAYEVDFDVNIADDDALANTVENQGYATVISELTGTVQFTEGVLTSIDFDAEITFTYDFSGFSAGFLDYTGQLTFTGDRFLLDVDDTAPFGTGNVPFRYTWESTGVVDQVSEAPPLPGDFDGSGSVDIGDYQLWRLQFGAAGPIADGNNDGAVDTADYTVWRDAFTASQTVAATSRFVPEPASAALAVLVLAGVVLRPRADHRLT